MAIAADDAVPDEIKKAAVPVLCREALEATAWDVFAAKAYAAGWSREAVEQAWQDTKETRQRIALALYLEPKRDIKPWLDGGSARRNATWVAGPVCTPASTTTAARCATPAWPWATLPPSSS